MSSLNAWIRFFELCLNVSYRLDFKKWQARGDAVKEQKKYRKKKIQDHFRQKLGLIDQRTQGFGSRLPMTVIRQGYFSKNH
jgi:hypothetical protein